MSAQEELITVDLCERCGIIIGGELDILTAPVILEVVPELTSTDKTSVDVDLSNVTFADASGVRALLCLKHAVPAVRVVAVSPSVERVLKLTDTYEVLVDTDLSEDDGQRVAAPTA